MIFSKIRKDGKQKESQDERASFPRLESTPALERRRKEEEAYKKYALNKERTFTTRSL